MISTGTATIRNIHGFHIRPTTSFVEIVKQFTSSVVVEHGDRRVNGASPMELISLGVAQDDKITITCEGDDAEALCQALLELVESRFGGIQ
ncbi:MAG: HPr family phosphocarrier protein [Planctomycetes bacterium]|nr:HPr family phosphocarrier protein [Planctomycetota bacterium]